jgi:hypothetical protein
MTIPITGQPVVPDLSDPATFNTKALNLFTWITGSMLDQFNNVDPADWFAIQSSPTDFALGKVLLTDSLRQLPLGRNLIINGSGRVNQRAYVSGAATIAANQFTLDRWFVITSGQNLTFTGNNAGRTMTAPAGGVSQVIEGESIVGGTYVINWTGTATCTVNGTARAKSATFTLTANTNCKVIFSSGTFSDVQLELGTVPTVFEQVDIGSELAKCQRYFWRLDQAILLQGYGIASGAATYMTFTCPVPMRAIPTATATFANGVNNTGQSVIPGEYICRINLLSDAPGGFVITYSAGNTFTAELTT